MSDQIVQTKDPRINDKKSHAEYMREWRKNNPDKVKAMNERRKAKRKKKAEDERPITIASERNQTIFVVPSMSEHDYRSHPAISRSELWKMNESPEKFKWFKDHPLEPTPALLFGQVTHKLLLQPESFDAEFAIAPAVDRRSKLGKEIYDTFVSAVGERSIVSADDYHKAMDMVTAVRLSPLANKLLAGAKEVPFFWTDETTGEDCKCRVDCLTEIDGQYYIVDYKTTGNAQTDIFSNKDVFKFGYYFQAAMYSEGVMHGLDLTERPQFVFIVQEKTAPFAVNVIAVPDDVMLAGLDKYRELLGKYHECRILDAWYGYNGVFNEMNEVQLPGWMQLGVEEDEE